MFAVIKTGGKQYKVTKGDTLRVEKLSKKEGVEYVFPDVLLFEDGGKVEVGTPMVKGITITGKIKSHGKGAKAIVFKYKPKKRYRKKKGHRQPFTEIEIVSLKRGA